MSNLNEDLKFTAFLKNTEDTLFYIGSITLLPFGLISNSVSIIIFARKRFKSDTMGFYNIIISTINLILIFIGFIIYFTQSIGRDVLLISDFSCKYFSYNLYCFVEMSSCLNIFMTADRMISIAYPNRFRILKDKRKLILLILILFLSLAMLNIPNLLFKVDAFDYYNPLTNETKTLKYCTASLSVVRLRDVVVLIFRYIAPIVLTSVMNAFLLIKVFKVKNRIINHIAVVSTNRKEYTFSVSVVALNFLLLISLIPSFMARIYLNTVNYEETDLILTRKVAEARLLSTIGLCLTTINFCFSFVANLAFNRLFKSEFFLMMNKIFKKYK